MEVQAVWKSKEKVQNKTADVEPGKWYSWGMNAEHIQLEKYPSRQGGRDRVSGKGKTESMKR